MVQGCAFLGMVAPGLCAWADERSARANCYMAVAAPALTGTGCGAGSIGSAAGAIVDISLGGTG
jgi:hypothetical protein